MFRGFRGLGGLTVYQGLGFRTCSAYGFRVEDLQGLGLVGFRGFWVVGFNI